MTRALFAFRRTLAPVLVLIAAGLSISCNDALFGGRQGRLAHIAIAPQFSRENAAIYKSLEDFALQVNALRIVLRRPNSDVIIKDTTVAVAEGDTVVVVELKVEIAQNEELFNAALEMKSGNLVLFSGSVNVVARAVSDPTERPPVLVPVWVGPGAQATRIQITTPDTAVRADAVIPLAAIAYDANNAVVSDQEFVSRFEWTVLDTALGSIPEAGGSFTARGTRGTARVRIRTPNLLSDTITITLVPPISFTRGIEVLDSGATRSAPAVAKGPDGAPLTDVPITYTSRATNIATVSTAGVITGVAPGQAVIVASATAAPSVADSLLAVVAHAGGPVVVTSLDRMRLRLDTTITVSVFVEMGTSTKKLGSATIDLEWNPAQLAYQSHANGAQVAPTVNSSGTSSGKLTLAMADVAGFTGRVELIKVTFKTTTTGATGALAAIAREVNATDYSDLLPLTISVTHALKTP
jgi:hypothetical protein